ncbi:hypothetical protein HMPREF1977_1356 [Capnocytophaga ochracea F0287]|uniref:Uncharacterized protein n=1 Tax=Capnocytophaga ochracea F0287 TaxID=873517 RepID=E4MSI3_CAPOC|nr:hypothetical protein HMPREF1977_1356 [Capnocytophaga ochracea F0287]
MAKVRAARAKTLAKFEMKKRCVRKWLENSEGNEDFQKETKRLFDEKRV